MIQGVNECFRPAWCLSCLQIPPPHCELQLEHNRKEPKLKNPRHVSEDFRCLKKMWSLQRHATLHLYFPLPQGRLRPEYSTSVVQPFPPPSLAGDHLNTTPAELTKISLVGSTVPWRYRHFDAVPTPHAFPPLPLIGCPYFTDIFPLTMPLALVKLANVPVSTQHKVSTQSVHTRKNSRLQVSTNCCLSVARILLTRFLCPCLALIEFAYESEGTKQGCRSQHFSSVSSNDSSVSTEVLADFSLESTIKSPPPIHDKPISKPLSSQPSFRHIMQTQRRGGWYILHARISPQTQRPGGWYILHARISTKIYVGTRPYGWCIMYTRISPRCCVGTWPYSLVLAHDKYYSFHRQGLDAPFKSCKDSDTRHRQQRVQQCLIPARISPRSCICIWRPFSPSIAKVFRPLSAACEVHCHEWLKGHIAHDMWLKILFGTKESIISVASW